MASWPTVETPYGHAISFAFLSDAPRNDVQPPQLVTSGLRVDADALCRYQQSQALPTPPCIPAPRITLPEGWLDSVDANRATQLLSEENIDKQARADAVLEHTLPRLCRNTSNKEDPQLMKLVRAVMAHSSLVHLRDEEFDLALDLLKSHCHPTGSAVVAEAELARLTRRQASRSLPKRSKIDKT